SDPATSSFPPQAVRKAMPAGRFHEDLIELAGHGEERLCRSRCTPTSRPDSGTVLPPSGESSRRNTGEGRFQQRFRSCALQELREPRDNCRLERPTARETPDWAIVA